MDANLGAGLMAVAVLLALAATSAAAHAAVGKLNKGRLRFLAAEGVPRARFLLALAEDSSAIDNSLAAANAAALALCVAVATTLMVERLGYGTAFYAFAAAGLVTLLWVQLASRAAGSRQPEETLHLLRWPLHLFDLGLRPLVLVLRGMTALIVRGDAGPAPNGMSAAGEELRMIVDAVEEEGSLEEGEKEMIHGIFEMGERTAREIMVPRVDVVAVEASEPLRVVLDRIKDRGHSRIPIYEESIDNVVGVVYAKDLLRHMEAGSLDEPARGLARKPAFIPESKKIDELLHEMQLNHVHFSIVVDEYGGTAGIVTIEDLLEEIVGEIQDEYDVEEKTVERLSDQEAVFDARVSIHDVNDTLSVSLADAEYDTVGGLVYDRLGKIPVVGDEVQVDGLRLTVLSTVGKRMKKVKIRVESDAAQDRTRED